MTTDEHILQLKEIYDTIQVGLPTNKIAIREGIVLEIGEESRFSFEFFCWRSPEMVAEMDAFFKYTKGKICLLDVGAYTGIYSLVFAEINKQATVHAFEPYIEPLSILTKNIAGKNITEYQAALSDQCGKLRLYEANGHLNEVDIYNEGKEVFVNAVTGDAFCFGVTPNIAPDVIKIDVEAGELKVLTGLQNVIAKHRPIVFIEVHYSQLSEDDVIKIMEFIGWFKYIVIDTETDKVIPLSDFLRPKKGEKRYILK